MKKDNLYPDYILRGCIWESGCLVQLPLNRQECPGFRYTF